LKVLALILISVGCLLVAPGAALAAEYTVDSTLDESDALVGTGGCLTLGGKCTLRAAVQESNNSVGTRDTIKFAAAFNGELADTIALGASFPVITDPVTIDADGSGQCATAAAVSGPCAGVSGPTGGFGLQVEDDEVVIEGLAVTGALAGINVINASEDFAARGNWIGVKLDGTAGANNTGVFIDPNSNGATIGGTAAAERNVIANNNNVGLDIEGASETAVLGNYFGVAPNGSTAAPNPTDIDASASTAGAFPATENEIGRELSPAALATPACDGACNVISGATGVGVDLEGTGPNEAPSGGPTTVQGNYIGLNAAGDTGVPNSSTGVAVGGADKVTIGGSLAGEANHINGGTFGVQAGGLGPDADELVVQGNLIGLNVAGTATLAPPANFAIFNDSEGISNEALEATISDNRISMIGGEAILQHGSGATFTGNVIGRGSGGQSLGGGTVGFRAYGNQSFGSILEGNVIDNAGEFGVLIEDDENLVAGNQIGGSGTAGVRIQSFAVFGESSGNLIGGDTAGEQNTISGSGGDAIVIGPGENNENEIARNIGSGNGDLFIDLGADGSGNAKIGGPNEGVQAPTILGAKLAGASGGGALPGATIRVFRKATASAGEIESFLGKATADGSGNWSVSYAAAIPGDTQIAVTQTGAGFSGTSELAFAKTEPAPKAGGGGTGGGAGDGKADDKGKKAKAKAKSKSKGKDKKGADTTPPQTTIRKGPKAKTRATTVRFRFVSSEEKSHFECKLDRKRFKKCKSPKKYKGLRPGKHVFKVRAVDAAGNADPTPAKRKFRILK
jgi:hypothetical protein